MAAHEKPPDVTAAPGEEPVESQCSTSTDPLIEAELGRYFLAASADCIKLIGPDGRLRFITDHGCRLMEVSDASQIRDRPWWDIWPEDQRKAVVQAVSEANAGRVAHFSGFCPTLRGTPKWWDVVVSPVFGAGGRLVYLLAISRDVTTQRTTEQSLRTSEQRFRALADNIAQLAWIADASGYVFWFNQRWFDYTGTTLAETAGWGWTGQHHPDHVDRVVKKITASFESGEVWEDVFPLRGRDGTYRWFLTRAMPIRDETGRVQLWCGTHTDVTEQRLASQRLRQLARIIELSHEAMLAWDMDGGIVLWNKGCEELYGFTKAEALGAVGHVLLRSRYTVPVAQFQRRLVAAGSWSGELLQLDKDGAEVWVDSRQELIPVGGRNIVLETNRDITDRRMADRQRDLLVAELNHRVRNTLAMVQSIAAQTARSTGDLEDFMGKFSGRLQALSQAHHVLTDTHWSGAFLRRLVAAELEVAATPSHTVETLGPDIFLPPQAALQMTLILHELATNALQHGALSTPEGRVTIEWELLDAKPQRLRLKWRERGGPSVSEPSLHGFGTTLIERSGRLPHLTTELRFAPEGVECIATVDLVADTGGGAPAYFDPAGAAVSRPVPDAPRRTFAGARRVLIVEDQPLHASFIEEILSEAGYLTIGPLHSIEAVVKGIAEAAFDVVLIDIDLPGLPLADLLEELRRRGIPVVVMSENGHSLVGPNRNQPPSLRKPVSTEALLEAVRESLDVGGADSEARASS